MGWAETTSRWDKKYLSFCDLVFLILEVWRYYYYKISPAPNAGVIHWINVSFHWVYFHTVINSYTLYSHMTCITNKGISWSGESVHWCVKCLQSWHLRTMVYRQISNIRHTLVGNKLVDHSDVVGASPVGAAPTKSSFATKRLAWIGQRQLQDEARNI